MQCGQIDLLIVGLGGQGIVSLARTLVACADDQGVRAISTLHKGGAQTLGTVIAEIRFGANCHAAQIPVGQLDVLVALDTWEALRAVARYGLPRAAEIEDEESTLQLSRGDRPSHADALDQLGRQGLSGALRAFRRLSLERFGTARMHNYLAGVAVLPHLPPAMRSEERFTTHFRRAVPAAHGHLGSGLPAGEAQGEAQGEAR